MFERAVILSEDELTQLCCEWQERLKIKSWTIMVRICRYREFSTPEVGGEVSWKKTLETAVIRILDPDDFPPDSMRPQDMEVVLVHELLHLRFAEADMTPRESLAERLFELAIQHTAEALVRLKREAEDWKAGCQT